MNYYIYVASLFITIVNIITKKAIDNCDLFLIFFNHLVLAIGYYNFKYPTKTPLRIISHNGAGYVLECIEEAEVLEAGIKEAGVSITPVVEASILKYQIIPTAYANLV